MTHEQRHRVTATLSAALHRLAGAVGSRREDLHRHEGWLRFLRLIDHRTPKHLQLHLIVDNDATHKLPQVQAWLARHPRVVMHFAAARASWLNTAKRFLRDMAELQQAVAQHIEHRGRSARPFVWTASAHDIASAPRA